MASLRTMPRGCGPPGTGNSMLAKRVASIMPMMTEGQAVKATKIHSIAGVLDTGEGFLATRPFRSPHHTFSDVGLLGGSANPSPGEVSLAHHGVLILDELPEFRRSTLEVLRQPLEDGKVSVSRAAGTMTFPARFMLVTAMNPCPCGYQVGVRGARRHGRALLGRGSTRYSCGTAPPKVRKNSIRYPEITESWSRILKVWLT